jgi:tonB
MKRFWSFLLVFLFLEFSAHVQAQKKGKKSYKKRHKTEIRQRHSFIACFFDEPPQCELPKADEELDENRDYLITQVDEPPIFEVCKDNINKRKCFQDQLEQHVKTHFNPNSIDAEKSKVYKVYVAFRIDKTGEVEVLFSRSENETLKKEAERIISLLPKFIPAKKRGKNVKTYYIKSIIFENKNIKTD